MVLGRMRVCLVPMIGELMLPKNPVPRTDVLNALIRSYSCCKAVRSASIFSNVSSVCGYTDS